MDVSVRDKRSGGAIETLSAKDFVVEEDGSPQTISFFSHNQLPVSVVLMFDMTQTVHGAMKSLSQAGLEVLDHLKPQDEVAVMAFSSRVDLMGGFTENRQRAAEAMKTASWMADVEGTFLDEDMYEAVEQAEKARAGNRRVLIWLTDGTANLENASTQNSIGQHAAAHLHSAAEAMYRLQQSGSVVALLVEHTAETNRAIMSAGLAGTRMGDFEQYAHTTGGPVLYTTAKDAPQNLATLLDLIRARYTLGYKPARTQPPNHFCKLSVALTEEAWRDHPALRRKDVVVSTRSGYYR